MFGRKKKSEEASKEASPESKSGLGPRAENTKLFMVEMGVKSLSALKSKVQTEDDYKRTPLHSALEFEAEAKVVEFLLSSGANPDAQDDNGDTPLHYAAQNGDLESVRLLLNNKAKPNIINIYAKTPLAEINSKQAKHPIALYEELLQAGATGCFWEPLDIMSPKMKKALINLATKHCQGTEYDSQKNTLLHWAAHFGLVEETKTLLDKGIPVNARNLQRQTALMLANKAEQMAITPLLLAALEKK